MNNVIQATGATRTSLVAIIKRQMIDTVIETNTDAADVQQVRIALKKANFGDAAIDALALEVSIAAIEETGANGAK